MRLVTVVRVVRGGVLSLIRQTGFESSSTRVDVLTTLTFLT
jgi:hypothetical protein